MTKGQEPDPLGIPAGAVAAWQQLRAALERRRTPCAAAGWDTTPERDAVTACQHCPALIPCRAYALAADEPEGVWGGTVPRQRRRLHTIARLNRQET